MVARAPARSHPDPLGAMLELALAGITGAASNGLRSFVDRYRNDYAGFCTRCDIVPKSGGKRPLVLNEIQRLYVAARTPRDIVLKARQVGMTTEEQARDVWHFLSTPGARVTTVCQSITGNAPLRELSERYRVMFNGLRASGLDLRFRSETATEWVIGETDAKLTIVEAGASQAAAQKKGRAGTITRLHATEVAFWEHAGETLNAMLECVAGPEHGTEIVFESTPNGAGGDDRSDPKSASGAATFYWQCQDADRGISSYKLHFYTWMQESGYRTPLLDGETVEPETERERQVAAAGASPEQIKWYRQKVVDKGSDQTDQEYPSDKQTCWLVSGRSFFDRSKTTELLGKAADPIRVEELRWNGAAGQLRIFQEPQAMTKYVVAVDTSEGTGGDRGAAVVCDRRTGAHAATILGQLKPWDLARAAAEAGRLYNNAEIAVERNNHGHACLRALEAEQKYTNIFTGSDAKQGWLTHAVSRTSALAAFEQAHRTGVWISPDRMLIGELRTFVVKNGKPQAASGGHDDLVMAAVIGWDVCSQVPAEQPPPVLDYLFADQRALGFG